MKPGDLVKLTTFDSEEFLLGEVYPGAWYTDGAVWSTGMVVSLAVPTIGLFLAETIVNIPGDEDEFQHTYSQWMFPEGVYWIESNSYWYELLRTSLTA